MSLEKQSFHLEGLFFWVWIWRRTVCVLLLVVVLVLGVQQEKFSGLSVGEYTGDFTC
jgi:hypothetical protein